MIPVHHSLPKCINLHSDLQQPIEIITSPKEEVQSHCHEIYEVNDNLLDEQENNLVWFHGQDATSKNFVLENYLKTLQGSYIPIWIEPGESVIDFLSNWMQAIQKLQPDWKKLPPNYLEILQKSDKQYLFVLQDIRLHHRNILLDIGKHLKCLVLSKKQLNTKSSHCTFSKQDANCLMAELKGATELLELDQHERYCYNRLFLSIAIKAHQKDGQNFIDQWNESIRTHSNSSFISFFFNYLNIKIDELGLFGNAKLKKSVLASDSLIETLKEYQLIESNEDFIYFPEEVRETLLYEINRKSNSSQMMFEGIEKLCIKFQNETGHLFSEKTKWIIPHVHHLYKLHQTHCPDRLSFPLFSLMFAVGHFYTQIDHEQKLGPTAAKKISVQARHAIEGIVNRHYGYSLTREKPKGLFSNSDYQLIVGEMNKIHRHLAHLYINLQYQIGRTYSYMKDPDQKLGSKMVLEFAKQLALNLKYEGKSTLLLKLIDRNGLFFHLNEENQHDKVIQGYEALLQEGEVITLEYHKEPVCIDLKKDLLFQINCLEYSLLNMIEQNPLQIQKIHEYIGNLEKACDNLNSDEKTRPFLNLVKVFLKIQDTNRAQKLLEKLEAEKLTTLNQLQVIENQMERTFLEGKTVETSEYAKKYHKIAEGYYPSGYYAIYKYLHYEFEENCKMQEQGFRSLIAKSANEAQRRVIWNYYPEGYVESTQKKGLTKYLRSTKNPVLILKNSVSKMPEKMFKEKMGQWKVIEFWVVTNPNNNESPQPQNRQNFLPNQQQILTSSLKITHQLSLGDNTLILGDKMYSHLSQNGKLVKVIDLLKDKTLFSESIFGMQGAYRLMLEGVKPDVKSNSERQRFIDGMKEESFEWGNFYDAYKDRKANCLRIKNKDNLTISAIEVMDVVNAIGHMNIFKSAHPLKIDSNVTHLSPLVIEQIHFRSFATFACHAMKHLGDGENVNVSIFKKLDKDCHFLPEKFEEVAIAYLQKARQLIQESIWKLELPDQKDDSIINCTYFRPREQFSPITETVFNTIPEVSSYKRKIKVFEIEQKNLEYPILLNQNQDENSKKISDEINRLSSLKEKEREKLLLSQNELEEKISMTKTDMAVISIKREENSTSICFRTYFRKKAIELHKGFEIIDLRTSMESIENNTNSNSEEFVQKLGFNK